MSLEPSPPSPSSSAAPASTSTLVPPASLQSVHMPDVNPHLAGAIASTFLCCLPIGIVRLHTMALLKKIVQVPGLLVILNEHNATYRQIFTDGRPLPDDPNPSWVGYSSGRWEGDTLVVQSAGFRDGLWLDANGSPLTDAARITERFRRPTFGKLEIDVTVDDPKAYRAPWTPA